MLLLVALLYGQAPAIRAATGACAAGTLAVAPTMPAASGLDGGAGSSIAGSTLTAASPERGSDAGDAPPATAATGCASTLALVPPVSRLTATVLPLRAAAPPRETGRPSSHHPAPPFQPPRA
ncbi:MAG TPA: hypothetical protein VFS40_01635 [Gemmatimonadales bacterium]|nr:hypothetical protein [Gemmatimonadales bacterium]